MKRAPRPDMPRAVAASGTVPAPINRSGSFASPRISADRTGDGHGDLEYADTRVAQPFHRGFGVSSRLGSYHRHDPSRAQPLDQGSL